MKYAVACMVRFDSKEERDSLFNEIKTQSGTLVINGSFIEKHLCYHDEDPAKPCVSEERIEA